jgi:hypothetical protein
VERNWTAVARTLPGMMETAEQTDNRVWLMDVKHNWSTGTTLREAVAVRDSKPD